MIDHTKESIRAETVAKIDRQIKKMQEALLIIEGLCLLNDDHDPKLAPIYRIAHISHGQSYCAYKKDESGRRTEEYKTEGCGLWSEEIDKWKKVLKDSKTMDVDKEMHNTRDEECPTPDLKWLV